MHNDAGLTPTKTSQAMAGSTLSRISYWKIEELVSDRIVIESFQSTSAWHLSDRSAIRSEERSARDDRRRRRLKGDERSEVGMVDRQAELRSSAEAAKLPSHREIHKSGCFGNLLKYKTRRLPTSG